MSHEVRLDDELLSRLHDLDLDLTAAVQRAGCVHCGGRLDRADFPRKVRGLPATAEVFFEVRFGLCCSQQGCRRRSLPPSVRFLGRKLYAAVVIVLACIAEHIDRHWQETRRVARWLHWWRRGFGRSSRFADIRGRLAAPLEVSALPRALLERIEAADRDRRLVGFLALVAGVAAPNAHGG